jgi:F-type H+-transporting ATPase subunit b
MNNPLVQPDPGLYIWTILTFLILVGLLAKFAWGPLLKALESRAQSIRQALDDARQAKQELEQLHVESAKLLAQARAEAAEIISRSRSDSDRFRDEMKEKARAEAAGLMRNAERQIELETTRALQQIRQEAIDISINIASKLLQRNVSKEDNERLIEETFKQLETTRGAAR